MVCVVECQQFPPTFLKPTTSLSLNGTHRLPWTRADIARSLLTVGYGSRSAAIATVGKWRAYLLLNMVRGYINSALVPTTYFWNLEQSERVVVSFLFGQAFTHRFAQSLMEIPYLLHADGLWTRPGGRVKPKKGGKRPRPESRPDFIGYKGAEVHVFESKGRSRRWPTAKQRASALGQVSAVGHVIEVGRAIGIVPTSRVACFSCLKLTGSSVLAIDPPEDEVDLLELECDELFLLRRAHQFFLESPREDYTPQKDGFVGVDIGGFVYAIDPDVLNFLRSGDSQDERPVEHLQKILAPKQKDYAALNSERVSVGPDGVMVIDNTKDA